MDRAQVWENPDPECQASHSLTWASVPHGPIEVKMVLQISTLPRGPGPLTRDPGQGQN